MHHSHRTWFPFILIGLTLVLLLGVVAFVNHDSTIVEQEPILSEAEYQNAVGLILDTYEQNGNTYQAYEDLLGLRISEAQKEVHLDLVLLFGKLLNGEIDSIDQTLVELGQTEPWLIE